MRNNTGIVHILLILLIVVVGIILFFGKGKINLPVSIGSPVPTSAAIVDTLEWKTYTNKDLGIEFSYPANWNSIVEREIVTLGDDSYVTDEIPYRPSLSISSKKTIDLSQLERCKDQGISGRYPCLSDEGVETISLGGKNAIKANVAFDIEGGPNYVQTTESPILELMSPVTPYSMEEFYKILSTFKFTE